MGTNTFSIIRVGLLMKRSLMFQEKNLLIRYSVILLILFLCLFPEIFIRKNFDVNVYRNSQSLILLFFGFPVLFSYMGLMVRSNFISYWLLPAKLSEKFIVHLCLSLFLYIIYFVVLLVMVTFFFLVLYLVGNISQETILDFYQTFFSSIYYLMSRQTELSFIGLCKCLVVVCFAQSLTLLILTALLYINQRFRLIFGFFLLILIILFSIVSFKLCPTFFEYFWIQNMYFSFVVVSICFYAMSYYGFRNMQYKMWFNDVNKLER